jgi:hypothetical protein
LAERKAKLARLLARKPLGIVFNEHTDADGATVFRHACKLGLEGIVSKRLSPPYRSGPSRDWMHPTLEQSAEFRPPAPAGAGAALVAGGVSVHVHRLGGDAVGDDLQPAIAGRRTRRHVEAAAHLAVAGADGEGREPVRSAVGDRAPLRQTDQRVVGRPGVVVAVADRLRQPGEAVAGDLVAFAAPDTARVVGDMRPPVVVRAVIRRSRIEPVKVALDDRERARRLPARLRSIAAGHWRGCGERGKVIDCVDAKRLVEVGCRHTVYQVAAPHSRGFFLAWADRERARRVARAAPKRWSRPRRWGAMGGGRDRLFGKEHVWKSGEQAK